MRDKLIETREIGGHTYEMWAQQQFGWRSGNTDRTVYKMDGKRIARDVYRAALGEQVAELERATCQVCARLIGVKTGVIAHHGYTRPQHFYQTASCYGARRLCFEQDRTALGEVIETLKAHLAGHDERVAKMHAEPFRVVVREAHKSYRGHWVEAVYCEPDDPLYPQRQREWCARQNRERGALAAEIAMQEGRYAGWTPPASAAA